MHIAVQ